ncbi:MAG: hypothetical protein J6R61_07490, partial [Bacteroidales bacterium]|nr:hypothetical protein [Bacteroidales bacterium]
MLLHLFNPENDLALADGNANYCAPPSAMKIAYDLSSLPLWFAEDDDFVLLADNLHKKYYDVISQTFPLPQIYTSNDADIITKCSPWGWSLQIRRRFENLGFSDNQLQSVESIKLLR